MQKILDNLANLIKVKTIVTIGVMIVFMILALTDRLPPDSVMVIITMVVSFYFGTQTQKKG